MKKKIKKVRKKEKTPTERRVLYYEQVDSNKMSLQNAILEYRYMLGKSQVEFAEFTKVPLRTIKAFELGKSNPTLNTLQKMLRGSGLDLTVKKR